MLSLFSRLYPSCTVYRKPSHRKWENIKDNIMYLHWLWLHICKIISVSVSALDGVLPLKGRRHAKGTYNIYRKSRTRIMLTYLVVMIKLHKHCLLYVILILLNIKSLQIVLLYSYGNIRNVIPTSYFFILARSTFY